MAEFQEVMRQWKRRFEAERTLVDSKVKGLDALWLAMDNPDEIESLVMSWAEEHPEPVYPTWREWLIEQGVIQMVESERHDFLIPSMMLSVDEPIPADIAQKLGIEPKC